MERHGEDGDRFFSVFFATDPRHLQYMTDRQCPSEVRERVVLAVRSATQTVQISVTSVNQWILHFTCVVSLTCVSSTRGCLLPFLGDQRAAGCSAGICLFINL